MEFKKLSAVEVVETVSDVAHVLIEENGVIKRVPKDEVGGIKVASAAEVGQAIVVKAVDENGKPTEWECADMGGTDDTSGSGYDAIIKYNTNGDDSELVFGSYANILAKLRAGEWINVAIYKPEDGYSLYNIPVARVWYDEECYDIIFDFDDPFGSEQRIWLTSDNHLFGV